jgi:hypothetical protein
MRSTALRIIRENGLYAVPSNDNLTRIKIAYDTSSPLKVTDRNIRRRNFNTIGKTKGLLECIADILQLKLTK